MGELERWTRDDIITPEQAKKIEAFYPLQEQAPWGLILFSSFGAAVIGLGVILLIAHNWQDVPRLGKLAVITSATAIAHLAGFLLWKQGGWKSRIGEALFLLGTSFYGAGIWLVAQAYNIDEHFPNGFLLWALGALALSWVIQSTPQIIAAILLLAVWGSSESISFHQPQAWALALLIAGVAPLLVSKRSALLIAIWLTALYVLLFSNAVLYGGAALGFTAQLALSVALIALGRQWQHSPNQAKAGVVTLFFGYTGFFISANLLSFKGLVRDLLDWRFEAETPTALYVYAWGFFAAALVAWATLWWKKQKTRESLFHFEEWLCPIALIYGQVLAVRNFGSDSAFIAGVFKIIFAALAIMWMLRGCQSGSLRKTILGSVLFSIWIFARYFDLFDSLASRGVAFLFLGAALFAEAFYYRRMRLDEAKGNG